MARMCPGDSDYCPHQGCTTCQGPMYYFKDPDNGAGRIDERDTVAWANLVRSAWRWNRERGWFHDIGYTLQDVLRTHRYDTRTKGSKPDDPGWHECSCGAWEGYWSDFHPHVADHLRAVVVQAAEVNPEE